MLRRTPCSERGSGWLCFSSPNRRIHDGYRVPRHILLGTHVPMTSNPCSVVSHVMFSGHCQPEKPPHLFIWLEPASLIAQNTSFGPPTCVPWMLHPCLHASEAHASAA